MTKIMTKVLLVVMVVNAVLSNFTFSVFAANQPKANSKTNFTWNKEKTLNDILEEVERDANSDEVLLVWDIDKINGTLNDTGTYTLKYPIADNKSIEFEIKRKTNKSEIIYKVNGKSEVNNNKSLSIYSDSKNTYVAANKQNFPDTEKFKLSKVYKNGGASMVSFEIGKNGGAAFKYDNNTIKFLWKDGKMYFATNAMSRGNIYPFTLEYDINGAKAKETKNIFLGIDTNDGFIVKPYANADNNNPTGKPVIDQTAGRPITEYPGGDEVGVIITFNTPKEWNDGKKSYEFITPKTPNTDTEVIFNLGHIDANKKLDVTIENIYDNNSKIKINGVEVNNDKAEYKYSNNNGTLKLKKLESSTIYDNIFISAERVKDPNYFETIPATLPTGKIYTYPAYKIVALGDAEFYLEIEPFKGYNGVYIVSQGVQQGTLTKWSTSEDKTGGESKILISVPLDMISKQSKYFKVDFELNLPDGNKSNLKFTSQILNYKPDERDIRLATPKNLKIINANIIKKDEEKENLYLTLKWDIDNEDVLSSLIKQDDGKTFSVDYLFYRAEKPSDLDKEASDGNDFLGVKLGFNNGVIGSIKDNITYELPDKYKGNNISIIDGSTKTFISERTEVIGNKKKNILEANVTFKIPVSSKEDVNKEILQYPNTYFLATKGEYSITPKNGKKTEYETNLSLPVTLTLDGIEKIQVPVPQNLRVLEGSVTNEKFSIDYDTLKYQKEKDLLYAYNEIMLKTIGRELQGDSIKYDFYITQNKDLFDQLVEYSKDIDIPEGIKSKINKYDNKENMTEEGINVDIKNSQGAKGNLLDTLRSKGIVQVSSIDQKMDISKQKINFKGLDENETYYVVGRTNVTPYEGKDKLNDKIDFSKFTKLVTATTKKDGDNPEENEKVPPAPTKFIAKDITLNSVNLIWDRVKDNLPEGQEPKSSLEYQFIKTRGEQLPDSFLKSKDSYEKTWESLSNVKDKEGLRTNKDKLYEFDKEAKQFSAEEASKERYEYINWEGAEGNILDKTLSPNQIYFYYIRTVRVSDKGDEAYSVWVPLTFTTKNTTGPTNLRVEPKAEYDQKSEVVISFDIPKMDTSLIGTEYDLQYSIKQDLGDWSEDKTMPKDKLSFKENDDGKTIKVVYKITGLKSGTMYTIRVRMLNKPLDAPSMYSNEVEHRTDSDNTENDYDQDIENWENNFKGLIEDLKNQPYWFSKDTSSSTIVYYRPQYFDKIIATTNNSIIELASGKGGSYKEYYLPASAVISAFDENKGFKISYNGADVIFSAKTINPYDNDVIKKMAEEIDSKGGNVEDYFIKLSVDFKNNKYIIDGSDSLSPSALITLSVVGTKDTIATLDQNMLNYIEELLKTKEFSKDVKNKIKNLIKNKTDNKIMVQEIGKIVDSFKSKFGDELAKDLNSLSRKTSHIQYLTGDIIFIYTLPTDISIGGYKKSQGNWISVDVKDYLGKKAIYTKEIGEYIFAGKKLVINGAGNLPNGNQITNIVVKYGLDDFLGKDGNINLRAPMTRRTTIGSLARIAGASKMQDPIEFFKTKNIVLSTRNMDNNITSEEAVYLIMKTYEMRSGTKLETVKIRNYNLTSDIKNINKNYKKPIQVAFETGIYNNSNMNAKGTISVQEFLQSLVNMSTMLGI
ncbi:MAG: fibronectin type III domain-containing protein [Clostridiales bacterium]|nr:fibronectin type III domain-containing protein [Clostridiales bacterium]